MDKKDCRAVSRSGGRWWRRFEQGLRCERGPDCTAAGSPPGSGGTAALESARWVRSIGVIALEGGLGVEVRNAVSLHGGLPGAWPQRLVSATSTVEALLQHWREFGLPAYAQFDNDTIFQGSHSGRDSLGRVIRICLQLGVTPVFAPPREPGFQAAIENFNGRWQAKVWCRFRIIPWPPFRRSPA